jgi:predicted RNase H-like HicB family nuclease
MNKTMQKLDVLVYLIPEDDGRYSVLAANLPGAASHGDTEEEALANIVEALDGVIESYQEAGEAIPWTDRPVEKKDPRITERRVVVHV